MTGGSHSPRRGAFLAGVTFLTVLLALVPGAIATHSAASGLVHAGAPAAASHPAAAPSASPHPAARGQNGSTFSPYCAQVDTYVCVSIANQTEPAIVPPAGSYVSSALPNTTQDLFLIIKSRFNLTNPNSCLGCPNAPIILNVTSVLWNGDPYYSQWDGSIWHGTSPSYFTVNGYFPGDKSFPYWYQVEFSHTQNGVATAFPGMAVTWWIELTYNISGVFVHHEGPRFQFTYAGAWAFSPDPGALNYAGAAAALEDVNLTLTPRDPNWNDSVHVQLNTSQADAFTHATISAAYLDIKEVGPAGNEIGNATFSFPVVVNQSGFGVVNTSVTIPPEYAQVAMATVDFWITAWDSGNNQIVTPVGNYTVGGNGTFVSGIFQDDISVATNPTPVGFSTPGTVTLTPGQTVQLTISSRNPTTSINAAQIAYNFSYPRLHELASGHIALDRVRSTVWNVTLPALPVGSYFNFTVDAWDFTQRLEVSPEFGYVVPTFESQVPIVPLNASFFYIFIFDNGSDSWVTGATVTITGPSGYFNAITNSTFGVAYPNATNSHYAPLLVVANVSYQVTVNDPRFLPPGGAVRAISVNLTAYHDLSFHGTLQQGTNYIVLQEGNALLFYLNSTPPGPVFSSSPPVNGLLGPVPLAGILGLTGALIAAALVVPWYRQIRLHRQEEEKRITL